MAKPSAADMSYNGDKYLGTSYDSVDCQKLWEQMIRDAGVNKDQAGSNTWYRYIMNNGWCGTPEDCKKKFGSIPAGACLFIHETDGKEPAKYQGDGIGNLSHIGVYTGRTAEQMMATKLAGMDASEAQAFRKKVAFGDNAINSSSTRGCVATSKFYGKSINGGWNRVGLWNRFYYNDTVEAYFNGGGGGGGEPTVETTATVILPDGASGSTVNMRASASKGGALIDRVPVGSTVTVLSQNGSWCEIKHNGITGYMMTKFLKIDGDTPSGDTVTLTAEQVAQIDAALETIGSIIGRG